ncbi:hypothetical protein EZV62_014917 [Acer yangbiense]|uniref:CCHC-type domain-containing protein n=1 Tax=Acer yangbiense TaxID=1000413 RepID=A0A5C7HU68_9ROSI|nr:hypothetical protein EZV62_014917 [Acer yangbiense]
MSMADSEISKLYENLSLVDEDEVVLDMAEEAKSDGVEDVDRCLVGKVLPGKKGKFMRVKVRIDISKALKRWLKLRLGKLEEVTMMNLKYERLPEFCFACGKIGHCIKECQDPEAKKAALEGSQNKFGSWLKAMIPDRSKTRLGSYYNGSSSDRTRSLEVARESK